MQLFSFLKKEFVKNVLTLVTGSAISQAIIYASILLLTRLFSTELFGIYTLFSSATLILKPLATLQFELAIVLPKNNKDAINLFGFSVLITILFSILLLFFVIFLKEEISIFFKINQLSNFIYFLPLGVFLFSLISIFNHWNNRINAFKNISKALLVKSSIMSSSQIATGFSSFKTLGLIPGMILGYFFQLFFLVYFSFKSIKELTGQLSFRRMLLLAKKYKDIPVFNTVINITNNLSNELPVLLITKYFGVANSGIYGLAVKFSKAPVGIFQQSVSQVFLNKASKVFNEEGDLYSLVLKTVKHLFLLGACIFTPLLIISFYLDVLFGIEWTDVGIYSRILLPWLFVMFIASPITNLVVILNKQKVILWYDIFLITSRFLAFYIGYHFYGDILISLLLFSSVGIFFNIFILFYFFKISKIDLRQKTAYK